MENPSKSHERENPSPSSSPTSVNGGLPIQTPKLVPRSESNPYPTTFVQADSSNFKHVVQLLTGSSEKPPAPSPSPAPDFKNFPIPPIKNPPKKQQSFKLYERRNHLKNTLMINTLIPNFPRNSEILSPSILDFPSLALSPVTPLNDDPFDKSSSSPSIGSSSEEERAIAEKGFYLHPSPMNTPRGSELQLLSLFPETSPRVSSSSSSS